MLALDLMRLLTGVPQSGVEAYGRLLRSILLLLAALWKKLLDLLHGKLPEAENYKLLDCLEIPPDVARRPDPCLYSQRFLASHGLAVTWDNPDIVITNLDHTPAALPLDPNRDYLVRGTIHNASFDAALGVAVRCFVRSWGVDFEDRVPVEVDANGFPATRIIHIAAWGQTDAIFTWRTPNVEKGHYCVTVECYHPADREPANNVGQENTDVARRAAPGTPLSVVVPFYNRHEQARAFRIAVDAYQVTDKPVTVRLEQIRGPNGIDEKRKKMLAAAARVPDRVLKDPERLRRLVERDAMRGARIRLSPEGRRVRRGVGYRVFGYEGAEPLRTANGAGMFPLPPGWKVEFPDLAQDERGAQIVVAPRTRQDLNVVVMVPATSRPGERRRINLTAYGPANRVVGGVTLDILVEDSRHA